MDSELRPWSSSFIYYKKITNQKLSKGEKWHKKPLSQKKEALTNNFYFKTTKNNYLGRLKA